VYKRDELRESVRESFMGMPIEVNYPCNCSLCQAGERALDELGGRRGAPRLHIIIKPLNIYDKFQHAWFNRSKLEWSAMGAFVIALDKMGFRFKGKTEEERLKELRELMIGYAFEWDSTRAIDYVKQIKTEEGEDEEELDRAIATLPPALAESKREIWIPMRRLKREELQFYGVTDITEYLKEARRKYQEQVVEEVSIDELL